MNAALPESVRVMLSFALDLADDRIAEHGDEFDADDQAALDTLRCMAAKPVAAQPVCETPIVLRWDRTIMPADGDDDTIVACLTADGRPAALFLDDEHRQALAAQLADLDPDSDGSDLLTVLRDAITRGGGQWTTHRTRDLLHAAGILTTPGVCRRLLAALADEGVLERVEQPGRRYYIPRSTS